jgi:hypothetical protein
MKKIATVVAMIAMLGIVGCGGSDSSTPDESSAETSAQAIAPSSEADTTETSGSATQEIEDLNEEFANAFADKDAEAVCDLMSPQAKAELETPENTCEDTVPLGFALVDQKEIDRISNPVAIKIKGDRAIIEYESGDDGFADLVDDQWMIGQ